MKDFQEPVGPVLMFLATLLLAGCATVRQVKPETADAKLVAIGSATSLVQASVRIRELAQVYYETKRTLEKDIIGGGDNLTNLGILAGIGAVADAGIGYLKVLGVGAGVLGTYDIRYKPGQQRQFYLDGTLALGCIANRADKLSSETRTLAQFMTTDTTTLKSVIDTPEQFQAINALGDAVKDTHDQVVQVHRRLDEKLFSVISSQGFTTVRDNLIKSSIDAQKSAESVKGQAMSSSGSNLMAQRNPAEMTDSQPNAAGRRRLAQLETQLARTLADAITYKTDIAACSADFLK